MKIDKELLKLLASVSKDLAVAFYVAAMLTSPFFPSEKSIEYIFILTRNVLSGTLFLLLSWGFSRRLVIK